MLEKSEQHTVIKWRASNQQLRDLIARAIENIERFFPGLRLLNAQDDTPKSAREPAQILILADSEEAAMIMNAAVKAARRGSGKGRHDDGP
jgi:hypothetical protein